MGYVGFAKGPYYMSQVKLGNWGNSHYSRIRPFIILLKCPVPTVPQYYTVPVKGIFGQHGGELDRASTRCRLGCGKC